MRPSGENQNMLTSRSKKGLKKQRTEIVFRVLMGVRRYGVGWEFFPMGCGLCGLEFPPVPKEGHQASNLLRNIEQKEKREFWGLSAVK